MTILKKIESSCTKCGGEYKVSWNPDLFVDPEKCPFCGSSQIIVEEVREDEE